MIRVQTNNICIRPKDIAIYKTNELAKNEYCRIIGTESWKYDIEPSQFFQIWEDYQNNKQRSYPWDHCRYQGQVEAAQMMCRWIHHIYGQVSGLGVVQLEIQWI